MSNAAQTVLITGNTYPVKDSLKALGGRWDPQNKGWRVPADVADQARALVEAAPAPAPRQSSMGNGSRRGRTWRPCGYPGCHPNYCDECDGKGR